MSIELLKDYIYVKKDISTTSSHFSITSDIVLPDFKPNLNKILDCYNNIFIKDIVCDNNKVIISGTINYNLLYYSDDLMLNSIINSSKFSQEVSLSSIPDNSIFDANIKIENAEYELLNNRRIILKHIALISLTHSQKTEVAIVSDINDSDDTVQILKETVYVPNYLGREYEKIFFKENIDLEPDTPSISQIIKYDTKIKNISHKIVDDKVIINSDFYCSILFFSEDNFDSLESFSFEKNLSQVVNVPNITDSASCDISIRLSDISFNVLENSDGERRIIDVESIFDVCVTSNLPRNIINIADAYSFKSGISVDRETITFDDVYATPSDNFYFKNTLDLKSSCSDIKVHSVTADVVFSEYKLIDNDFIIDGILNISTLYEDSSDSEPFCVISQEYPFRHILDYNYPENVSYCTITVNVEDIDYNINIENNLEFKINLNILANVFCNKSSTVSTNISECLLDNKYQDNKPCVIVYFANENDSLWSIAKRYLTTVDALKTANGLTNDIVSNNQQILII